VGDDRSDVALLVAAAEQGDEDAWGEIVDRYTPLVVTVGLRYRLPSGELQDVAQTVWLRLIEHLCDLREPRALPRWLITTAKREALRSLLVSTRLQPTDPQDEAWESRLVAEDDPGADLVRSERHAALLEWFATLSKRQQQLLTLLAEDPPVPYAEISRRTGIPVGAIGPTRARALARLRSMPDPGFERPLTRRRDLVVT
jgi:RNA polymerase sigma factor (sigma-70 family)